MDDQEVVWRVGLVTASIAPDRLGEVKVAIRGGNEAFNAYAMDPKEAIPMRWAILFSPALR